MAELHPDADVTDGGWLNEAAGSTLNTSIDEITINDSDFIRSAAMPLSDVCEVALGDSGGTPNQPMTVSYRFKKSGDRSIGLVVALLQGSTEIVSWTHVDITTAFGTITQTLSNDEFSAISDFTDLRLRFESTVLAYAGPGDIISGALGWWGLRAYSEASIGTPAIRLRASGDNVESDFNTVAGGGLDTTAISNFLGAHGGSLFVRTLYDQAGSQNMDQATAGNQHPFSLSPLYINPTGSTSIEIASFSPTTSQPWSMAAVAQRTASTSTFHAVLADDSSTGVFFSNASGRIELESPNQLQLTGVTESTWHAIQAVANSPGPGFPATSIIAADGNSVSGNNLEAPFPRGSNLVSIGNDNFGDPMTGFVREAGVWPIAFSAGQITSLNSNAHWYWNF